MTVLMEGRNRTLADGTENGEDRVCKYIDFEDCLALTWK